MPCKLILNQPLPADHPLRRGAIVFGVRPRPSPKKPTPTSSSDSTPSTEEQAADEVKKPASEEEK